MDYLTIKKFYETFVETENKWYDKRFANHIARARRDLETALRRLENTLVPVRERLAEMVRTVNDARCVLENERNFPSTDDSNFTQFFKIELENNGIAGASEKQLEPFRKLLD